MLWRCWYVCHTEVPVGVKPTLVMEPEFLLLFLTNSMRRFVFLFFYLIVFCRSNFYINEKQFPFREFFFLPLLVSVCFDRSL